MFSFYPPLLWDGSVSLYESVDEYPTSNMKAYLSIVHRSDILLLGCCDN